jgi:hypothetical protein
MIETLQRNFVVTRGNSKMYYPFIVKAKFLKAELSKVFLVRLKAHLVEVLWHGHPDFIDKISASQASPLILPKPRFVKDDPVSEFAKMSGYNGAQNSQHLTVQRYMLDHDPHTIAIEIPFWSETHSCHVDIIRVFPEKIQFWDFKPKAHKETKATTQLWHQKEMVKSQLKLFGQSVEFAYFDENGAYYLI